ncbi:MAG TPA: TadE/TadG family type IV pilus assembly protein [Candidatus Dormibacteraeota bacterium]|nr:TadE/TadG family type IV pilus assembly protein [Candidatus Dormibacteraeota bacterium]
MQRGQSTVEFGAAAIVLIVLLFGLVDLGRVFYFDVGLTGAVREGARQASWFDPSTGLNPYLYDAAIKSSVDEILTKSGLPASTLQNSGSLTCPTTTDGNAAYNPPYQDTNYPAALNQPSLYICYDDTPGLDLTSAPTDNSYKGEDVNVILVMSFGFATNFLQGFLGNSVHIVANAHMAVGGY